MGSRSFLVQRWQQGRRWKGKDLDPFPLPCVTGNIWRATDTAPALRPAGNDNSKRAPNVLATNVGDPPCLATLAHKAVGQRQPPQQVVRVFPFHTPVFVLVSYAQCELFNPVDVGKHRDLCCHLHHLDNVRRGALVVLHRLDSTHAVHVVDGGGVQSKTGRLRVHGGNKPCHRCLLHFLGHLDRDKGTDTGTGMIAPRSRPDMRPVLSVGFTYARQVVLLHSPHPWAGTNTYAHAHA